MTGLLVQAERTGVTACVADPSWEFMVTSQFICTPAELRDGVPFVVYQPGPVPRGMDRRLPASARDSDRRG